MRIYVRSRNKNRRTHNDRGEVVVDIEGPSDYEAEEFVHEVRSRVTIRRQCVDGYDHCDVQGSPPRGGGTGRKTIDINLNINAK